MSRLKRDSKSLPLMEKRLEGMRDIDPALDLGGGISVKAADDLAAELRAIVNEYNRALSHLDEQLNILNDKDREAADLATRILAAVSARYGRNSSEYEKVGGRRLSERKRPARKATNPSA